MKSFVDNKSCWMFFIGHLSQTVYQIGFHSKAMKSLFTFAFFICIPNTNDYMTAADASTIYHKTETKYWC